MTTPPDPASSGPPGDEFALRLGRLQRTLDVICCRLAVLARPATVPLTTGEFATLSGRTAYTVRDYLKTGRLAGTRAPGGRGWRIAREELDRYEREGLRPKAAQHRTTAEEGQT